MNRLATFLVPRSVLPLVVLALVAWLAAPEPVRADGGKWTLRGAAVWATPTGDDLAGTLPTGEPFRFSVHDAPGLGGEIEYRPRPRFGIELAALATDPDTRFTLTSPPPVTDTQSAASELFSVGFNYHLTPARSFDLHIGAFAAIVYFDNDTFLTEIGRADKIVFDDDIGFGLKLGLDRAFGPAGHWLASASLRYLSAILEGETAGQDADLDPLILGLGIGYRF